MHITSIFWLHLAALRASFPGFLVAFGLGLTACSEDPPLQELVTHATPPPSVVKRPVDPTQVIGPPAPPGIWAPGMTVKLDRHADSITAIAVTPDGHTAVTGSADLTARVWNLTNGQQTHRLAGHTQALTAVAISETATLAVSGSLDRTVRLWDLRSGKAIRAWRGPARFISALAFAPKNRYVAAGDHDGSLFVWDLATGKLASRFIAHKRPINQLVFSSDGHRLLSASDDKTAVLWDWAQAKAAVRCVGHEGWVSSAALSPDGATILTGSADKSVRLWSTRDGALIHTYRGHTGPVSEVFFASSGKLVGGAGGSHNFATTVGPQDFSVLLWDVATGRETGQLLGHEAPVMATAALANGSLLSASLDETVRLWEFRRGP